MAGTLVDESFSSCLRSYNLSTQYITRQNPGKFTGYDDQIVAVLLERAAYSL
jgi:hypothetical protein